MDEKVRIAIAETFGTAVLVIGGPGTAILSGGQAGQLGVALAFGLSLLVMVYAIGHVSGCHINPAVTIGAFVARRIDAAKVPFYLGGQVLGGVLGGLVVLVIASGKDGFSASRTGFASNGFGVHSPAGYNLGSAALVEIVGTAIFVLVILAVTRKGSPVTAGAGAIIGGTLALVHLISIPVDNTSVNPARSLGTALIQHGWALGQLWAFIAFPLIGAVVAAGLWLAIDPDALHEWESVGNEPGAASAAEPHTDPGTDPGPGMDI